MMKQRFESVWDAIADTPGEAAKSMEVTLARKAAGLRVHTRGAPGETDVQLGHALLLEVFEQPHNLPLTEFARLADKSR